MYQDMARSLAASVRAMVPGVFTTRPASPATHPYVAWRQYERATRPLVARGFRHVADVEVTSIAVDPRMTRPPALRILVGDDGATVVGMYRMPLRWTPIGILARCFGGGGTMLDVMTHLADDTVVETSTAEPANVWATPPYLYRDYVPASAGLDALLARHRERLARHVTAAPGRTVVRYAELGAILARANDAERRKREHRIAIGWVTDEEIARLSKLRGERLAGLVAAVRRELAATEPPPAAGDREAA